MVHAQACALTTGVVLGAPCTMRTTAAQRMAVAPSTRRRNVAPPTLRHSSPSSSPAAASAAANSSASSSSSASAPSAPSSPSSRSRAGRATYAPETFDELVDDASAALLAALDDGLKRVEVEFPALPGDKDGELELKNGLVLDMQRRKRDPLPWKGGRKDQNENRFGLPRRLIAEKHVAESSAESDERYLRLAHPLKPHLKLATSAAPL